MLWTLLLTSGWVGQSVCQRIWTPTLGHIISKDDLIMTGTIGSAMPKSSMHLTISQLRFHDLDDAAADVDTTAAELGQLQQQKSITAGFLQPIVLKSATLTLPFDLERNQEENVEVEISA